MKLTILGCHSSTPRPHCHNSAQVLQLDESHLLIDCGEGTLMQMKKAKIQLKDIDMVLISHLHGDHFYGLIGFLTSHDQYMRTKPITVFGPKGLNEIVSVHLKVTNRILSYKLNMMELQETKSQQIVHQPHLTIKTIPLKHRIYTNGFLIEHTHTNISYAYCSDTAYNPEMVSIIQGVDWLYHEATFLETHSIKAQQTNHSTAKQAALIAQKAKVNQLIIGHYSSRYQSKENHLKEARAIFRNTNIAEDLKVFEL
ncbi:MAG: ribonuclease Z [Flavobacteriaceae bacterium]|nr:ribonuclease Z [Flavobacteriaceae bacterium]